MEQTAARPSRQRLASLDAIRGVCAILVAVRHLRFLTGADLFPSAYLPVDLFFMMSGYVIGYAYDAKLRAGGYFGMFMARRYARLLPMWIVGLSIAYVLPIAMGLKIHHSLDALIDYLPGLLLVPTGRANEIFPGNSPGWSLFFELIANAAYALLARRLGGRALAAICLVSLACLIPLTFEQGSLDGGAEWSTFALGLARVSFGFSLGLLAYRHFPFAASRRWNIPFAIALALLSLLLAADPSPLIRPVFDLLLVAVLLPAMLILGLVTEVSWPRTAEWLGMISYPIYAVHLGVMMTIYFARGLLLGFPVKSISVTAGMLVVLTVLVLADLLGRYVDPAAQRLAGRLLHRRPVRLPDPGCVSD